jgi:hypothetical protein
MACIYFFFNSFDFFPPGLMVTSILSPLFYIWLLNKKKSFVLEPLLIFLAPFAVVNFIDGGLVWKDYLISFLLLVTVYTTVYAFAVRLQELQSIDALVRLLIWINLAVAAVGLVVRFTPYYQLMWQDHSLTSTGTGQIRYRMFTYEPAHYAMIIVPLLLYAYWQFVQKKNFKNFRLLIAITIPFGMALSFGAVVAVALGILASQAILHRNLRQTKWFVAAGLLCIGVYVALPDTSHLKTRVNNVLEGNDSSTNVRTTASYIAAYEIAKKRDVWFGVGLGQSKLFVEGVSTWGQSSPRLGSVVADNLAEFGIVGLLIRFVVEAVFLFRGRPWQNPFRFSLFVVVFLLQFGGGYMSDPAEYFGWVMALSTSFNLFPMPVPVHRRKATFRAAPQPV